MYGHTGANNPMYGVTPTNAFPSGPNNPMYGKVAANAVTVSVYSLEGKLINSFSSKVAAAKWLNTSPLTVSRYIESGKVWNKLYTLVEKNSS